MKSTMLLLYDKFMYIFTSVNEHIQLYYKIINIEDSSDTTLWYIIDTAHHLLDTPLRYLVASSIYFLLSRPDTTIIYINAATNVTNKIAKIIFVVVYTVLLNI